MEKIRINGIDKKDSGLVIVKYALIGETKNETIVLEATLNTKWQSQEVDYLEKDVGIGGEVEVEIVQKGRYTNITKVNFKSAVPSPALVETQQGVRSLNGQEQKSVKDEKFRTPAEMVATELAKAVMTSGRDIDGKWATVSMTEAVEMYKEALELLG